MSEHGIPRVPDYGPALDFERLRRAGLAHIERLGHAFWTDYNAHDPGITLLEALCFAITDLGYRLPSADGWAAAMADLLAPPPNDDASSGGAAAGERPFFTAREILHCNPVTALDLRKLIVDVPGVKNAWVNKAATAAAPFYADRDNGSLSLSPPEAGAPALAVKGVHDVVIELAAESSPAVGDVNDNTIAWVVELAKGERLRLDVAFPLWDTWRRRPADGREPLQLIGDPWLQEGALRVEAVNPRVDGRGLKVDLKVELQAEQQTHKRSILGVLLSVAGDAEAPKKHKEALLAALSAVGDERHPIRVYRARLRRALAVLAEVKKRLAAHRPLCEDFNEPGAAVFEEVAVCTEIEVAPAADLEGIAAQVTLKLRQLWSPAVRFQTLSELLAAGVPVEKIFDGPRLQHGFILDEDLRAIEAPEALRASDAIRAIMECEGVIAVRSLVLSMYRPDGTQALAGVSWEAPLAKGALPRFAPDRSRIVFYKDGVSFNLNPKEIQQKAAFYAERQQLGGTRPSQEAPNDLPLPSGTYRDPAAFVSPRQDLPRIYAGSGALSESATPLRQAQAKQLQGYLLFFDALLANYLAQLSHVRDLFALPREPKDGRTWCDRPTTYAADLTADKTVAELFASGAGAKLRDQLTGQDLLADTGDQAMGRLGRQNRILDHLLARFNERFSEYAALMADLAGADPAKTAETLVAQKVQFLADYPAISCDRNKACDYTDEGRVWSPENVSGFERRLTRMLGLTLDGPRNLAPPMELYEEKDNDGISELRFRLRNDEGKILLSSSTRYHSRAAALAELAATVYYARERSAIDIKLDERGRPYFNILNKRGDVVARRLQYFCGRDAANAAADQIVQFLRKHLRAEGFHLVEHVLLRPRPGTCHCGQEGPDRLMSASLDGGCLSCAAAVDPYSFRATLIFPGWTERFSNMRFRQLCERMARLQAPAHVFLKICWVDIESMWRFETKYAAWLQEKAKGPCTSPSLVQAQNDLIETMESLSSVYPLASIHNPDRADAGNPALLDNVRLGTAPPEGT